MKFFLFLTLAFQFLSCNAIMKIGRQEINVKNSFTDLTLENNQPIVSVEVDSIKTKFLFDTGATGSVLIDSSLIKKFSEKEFVYLGSYYGADRKKQKSKFLITSYQSPLFHSGNKSILFLNVPNSKCASRRTYSGFLGLDVFFGNELLLMMNYSINQIGNITESQKENYLKADGYALIKSECKARKIFIFINIDNKEYKFKLDTGYNGSLVMPNTELIENDFSSKSKLEMSGSMYSTISTITVGKELVYEKMPISFAGESFEAKVSVSSSIKTQNVGMAFIKGFDWIIDYNNNKVYAKRNQHKIENTFNRRVAYYARAGDKLRIITKEKSQTKYNLGDEIISVNGQRVTAENLCEFQDLLNKTEDWNMLALEVIPSQTN